MSSEAEYTTIYTITRNNGVRWLSVHAVRYRVERNGIFVGTADTAWGARRVIKADKRHRRGGATIIYRGL